MNSNVGTTRGSELLEILLWLVALGVLAANIALLQENRRLRETLAPQNTSGTQFDRLWGLTLDGRFQPLAMPSADSKLLIITLSPSCPACQANQEEWMRLTGALQQKSIRVVWVSRDPVQITKDYCVRHGIPLSDVMADPPHR